MSEVISSSKSLRDGLQVFALLKLSLCVILHTMWSGKSLQLLCILSFGKLCLSAISMMLYNVLYTVVISGDDVYCSMVFGTRVGVFVLCGPSC